MFDLDIVNHRLVLQPRVNQANSPMKKNNNLRTVSITFTPWWLNNHIESWAPKSGMYTLDLELSPRTPNYCDECLLYMSLTSFKKWWKSSCQCWGTWRGVNRINTHWLRYSEILWIIPSICSINICGWTNPVQALRWQQFFQQLYVSQVLILLHGCGLLWPSLCQMHKEAWSGKTLPTLWMWMTGLQRDYPSCIVKTVLDFSVKIWNHYKDTETKGPYVFHYLLQKGSQRRSVGEIEKSQRRYNQKYEYFYHMFTICLDIW